VHATAEDHADLFWAVRGGGGNVGVVTAFEFVAAPTTDVFHGRITFPAAEAGEVLQGWAEYMRAAPEDLTSVVALANPVSGGPHAPVEVHVTVDDDDPDRATDTLDPIRRLGTVLADDVALTPYADTLVEGATPPPGLRFSIRSAFVDKEAVPDALRVLADAATSDGAPAISVRALGGAVARVPDDATAYAHRQAELLVVTLTAGPPSVVEAARPGLDRLWARLEPQVDGAYANFLTAAGEREVAAVYPAGTRERLARVKERYDPQNLFSGNHNIRPAGTQAAITTADEESG
jgi:FAD/FMN-containing dehydrogenase